MNSYSFCIMNNYVEQTLKLSHTAYDHVIPHMINMLLHSRGSNSFGPADVRRCLHPSMRTSAPIHANVRTDVRTHPCGCPQRCQQRCPQTSAGLSADICGCAYVKTADVRTEKISSLRRLADIAFQYSANLRR